MWSKTYVNETNSFIIFCFQLLIRIKAYAENKVSGYTPYVFRLLWNNFVKKFFFIDKYADKCKFRNF